MRYWKYSVLYRQYFAVSVFVNECSQNIVFNTVGILTFIWRRHNVMDAV